MKSSFVGIVTVGVAAFMIAVFGATSSQAQNGNSDIQRGYALAPVPLNRAGLNPALVGLGSYIVNAQGGCNDCHTNPSYAADGNPFAGEPTKLNAAAYLAGGQEFGPFISRNLTPRANGRPAGLTLAQFIESMRTGKDQKEAHTQISPLLQVMPWPVYGNMSDRELEAIYEYLRAIPCVGSAMRCGN